LKLDRFYPRTLEPSNPPKLAYVLCAGIGKRLRPLTIRYPKALLPVGGRPMVFHVLDALCAVGVRRFLVNLHAHPAVLRRELRAYGRRHRVRFMFLYEKKLLDTGGALRNAAEHLIEPFWLVNCDFFPAGFSFAAMARAHAAKKAIVTLAIRPMSRGEPFTPVGLDRRGRIIRVSGVFGAGGRDHVFLGVHRIDPAALAHLSFKKIFPIFSGLYRNLFQTGRSIHAFVCRPAFTFDLGTLEGYYSANFEFIPP